MSDRKDIIPAQVAPEVPATAEGPTVNIKPELLKLEDIKTQKPVKGTKRKGGASAKDESHLQGVKPEDIAKVTVGNDVLKWSIHHPLPIKHVNFDLFKEYRQKKMEREKESATK